MRTHKSKGRRRGFTAIELTAVASIIAILALILIPIVRKRVDQTRIVAATDDMKTIETAQILANADTGKYFRLSDLDNGPADLETVNTSTNPTDIEEAIREVPRAYWNEVDTRIFNQSTASAVANANIVRTWGGPYTTFNRTKFEPVQTLVNQRPELFRVVTSAGTTSNGNGPILALDGSGTDADSDFDSGATTPVDPWGSPYIFFGPGRINSPTGGSPAISTSEETNFGTSIVYSLGPDGFAGDPDNLPNQGDPATYFRESGFLAHPDSDDLYRVF